MDAGAGNAGALAEAGAKQIMDSRASEKKSMQDLNNRFANYIEKNRFLEAQLKSVEQRLKDLQDKWGMLNINSCIFLLHCGDEKMKW